MAVLLCLIGTARAAAGAPPGYTMRVTPVEGPVDPAVAVRYTAAFTRCLEGAVTTADSAGCWIDEFSRQDTALSRAWVATLDRVAPADRATLRRAERRWAAARDPFCARHADDFSGGSILPVIYHSCRVEQTIRRTRWLEALPAGRSKTLPPAG